MKTVYSPLHAGHGGTMELVAGEIVPGFEKPSRAEIIRARVESEKLGPVLPPRPHDLTAAKRIHRADYIDFLPTVYPAWEASGRTGSALPSPGRRAGCGETCPLKPSKPGLVFTPSMPAHPS